MWVLSFRQPYAELILQGRKKIDVRKRGTIHRGDFLIHASKLVDRAAMRKYGFAELPTGCIVGVVDLREVKKYRSGEEFEGDRELHLVDDVWGDKGYVLEDPRRVEEIPWKGQSGWGHYDGKVKLKTG